MDSQKVDSLAGVEIVVIFFIIPFTAFLADCMGMS